MPNRLSGFETDLLNEEQQNGIIQNKNYWEQSDKNKNNDMKQSDNWRAEEIRKEQGFSGGIDGSSYIPIDNFKPLEIPGVNDFNSPYENELMDYLDKFKNQWDYVPPYQKELDDLINKIDKNKEYVPKYEPQIQESINKILNNGKFEFDINTDPSWLNFLDRVQGASENAYELNMEGFASMSGGNTPEWVEQVAREAQDAMNLQAMEYVEQFEDSAYGKHTFYAENDIKTANTAIGMEQQSLDQFVESQKNNFELLKIIQNQDAIAYNRFRDKVNDDKEFANMLLKLDEREFERFKFTQDQAWRKFNEEANQYKMELDFKQQEWQEALTRTELVGYVQSQDSILLQVPTGTLSKSARERVEALDDWKRMQDIQLEYTMKKNEYNHDFNMQITEYSEQLDFARYKNKLSYQSQIERVKEDMENQISQAKAQNGLQAMEGEDAMIKLSDSDWKKAYKLYDKFNEKVNSPEFKKKSKESQMTYISSYIDKVNGMSSDKTLGKNGMYIASWLEDKISTNLTKDLYKTQSDQILTNQTIIEDLESISLRDKKGISPYKSSDIRNTFKNGYTFVSNNNGTPKMLGFDKYLSLVTKQQDFHKEIDKSVQPFYTDYSKRADKEKEELSKTTSSNKNIINVDLGNTLDKKKKKKKKK